MAGFKHARRYAEAGYPVMMVYGLKNGECTCGDAECPKKMRGKHPIHNAWQKRATTDLEQLREWCERYPDAHLGILPPEGHCIIDIDPRNGGTDTLKGLMNGSKLPRTVTQKSGGGGMHLIYRGAPSGPLGKGIDVKKPRRGYVVVWPAAHISGGSYEWDRAPWDYKAKDLPEFLQKRGEAEDLIGDRKPVTKVPVERIRAALEHVNADDYQRWINIGHALKHAYGDEGEEIWLEWSKTSDKYKEGDEIKWETLDRNRDRPLITVRTIMSLARKGGFRPLATEFNDSLWTLGDIAGYVTDEAPPLDWVVEPCIPAGKVTLLAGAGGSSKSYFALTLGMFLPCLIQLGPFKPTKLGKTLAVVAEEDKEDVHRRIRAIIEEQGFTDEQLAAITDNVGVVPVRGLDWRLLQHDESGDLQETDRVDYLIDEVRALGDCRLLILDPLVAFNGADENNNVEMARLMFTLDRIAAATGAAVLVIHHVSKGGQQNSLNEVTQGIVRGASALVDNARALILFVRMPRNEASLYNINAEEAGRYLIARVLKNNYGPHVKDTVFRIEKGGVLKHAPEVQQVHRSVTVAAREMEGTDLEMRVLMALEKDPEASQRDLAESTGKSAASVNRALKKLVEDGAVHRSGVGGSSAYELTKKGRRRLVVAGNDDEPADDGNADLF